jgi:hydroxyacylglutathione hydrolase
LHEVTVIAQAPQTTMTDSSIAIVPIPFLSDNYAWLMRSGTEAAVVDPGDAGPIRRYVREHSLHVSAILVTHHHGDHCGGVGELKNAYGCTVIGFKDRRMPFVDEVVENGDTRTILGISMRAMATPGHTLTHAVYFFPDLKALFTGDTLFGAGCGRLFEGTADQMLASLIACAATGDDVRVYAGHEYTEENLRFAQSVEPGNAAIPTRLLEVQKQLRSGQPSLPSLISVEKAVNPFLRTDSLLIRKQTTLSNASNVEVFAELRKRKDAY